MRGYALEGKMRSQLREAILAGFDPPALDEVLRDNDMLRPNIALGPDFASRVNSVIDIADREGWLTELCRELAVARVGNLEVHSAIAAVRKYLQDQRHQPMTASEDAFARSSDHFNFPKLREHRPILALLAGLIAVVIGTVLYLSMPTKENADRELRANTAPPKIEAHTGGVAIGGDVKGSTINIAPRPADPVAK